MDRQPHKTAFKVDASRLCEATDRPVAQVARELGINPKLLYRWREEQRRDGGDAFPGHGQHSSRSAGIPPRK